MSHGILGDEQMIQFANSSNHGQVFFTLYSLKTRCLLLRKMYSASWDKFYVMIAHCEDILWSVATVYKQSNNDCFWGRVCRGCNCRFFVV